MKKMKKRKINPMILIAWLVPFVFILFSIWYPLPTFFRILSAFMLFSGFIVFCLEERKDE